MNLTIVLSRPNPLASATSPQTGTLTEGAPAVVDCLLLDPQASSPACRQGSLSCKLLGPLSPTS